MKAIGRFLILTVCYAGAIFAGIAATIILTAKDLIDKWKK